MVCRIKIVKVGLVNQKLAIFPVFEALLEDSKKILKNHKYWKKKKNLEDGISFGVIEFKLSYRKSDRHCAAPDTHRILDLRKF